MDPWAARVVLKFRVFRMGPARRPTVVPRRVLYRFSCTLYTLFVTYSKVSNTFT